MSASKKVIKAMSIFGGVQGLNIICSVVRAKLIALWIGPAGVGLFAIFNNAMEFVATATQLSLRQSAVRDLSDANPAHHPRLAGVVKWWALRLGLLGAAVMAVLSPLLSYASFGNMGWWWAFALLGIAVFCLAITSGESAVMQGVGHLRNLAKAAALSAIVALALCVPLYYCLGIESIVPAILVYAIVTAAMTRMMNRQESVASPRQESVAVGMGFMRLGAYLTVSAMAATGASYLFVSYLNSVSGPQATGIYQAGYTLVVRYVGLVFTAIGVEYYPRLSRLASKPRFASLAISHEMALLLSMLAALVVAFVIFDDWAIRLLYSEEFLAALPMVDVGILGVMFQAVSYCMAFLIIARGDGKAYVFTDVSSAVIGLVLNVCMYNQWGMAGLGWSYVLWYMIYAAMVWIVCHKRYGMRITRRALLVAAAALAIAILAVAVKQMLR